MMRENKKLTALVESAILLAVATVLSFIRLLDLPYGGSITACSMLPILLISYRHGVGRGALAGLAYGIIQFLLGMGTVSYFTSPWAVAAVIVMDFLLAFTGLGLGGVFRKEGRSQAVSLTLGALLGCALRYLCHVVAGATVWAGLSIPSRAALLYSFGYNATYMIPETVITLLGGWYLGTALNLETPVPTRLKRSESKISGGAFALSLLGKLILLATALVDVLLVLGNCQDPETGNLSFAALANADWPAVAIVTACGILGWFIVSVFRKKQRK